MSITFSSASIILPDFIKSEAEYQDKAISASACREACYLIFEIVPDIKIRLTSGDEREFEIQKRQLQVENDPKFESKADLVFCSLGERFFHELKIKTIHGEVSFRTLKYSTIETNKPGRKGKFILKRPTDSQQMIYSKDQVTVFEKYFIQELNADLAHYRKFDNLALRNPGLFADESVEFLEANPLVKDFLLSIEDSESFM